MRTLLYILTLGIGCLAALAANAETLPRQMTWSSHGISSAAFAQAVAIGKMLKKSHGTEVTVLRGGTPAARLGPLRERKAGFCICGSGAYFAQEGVFQFAGPDWGPQPLRVVAIARNRYNFALAAAADAGIRKIADLKGKRVSWLKGRDAVNWGTSAHLAFAGLSWHDVKVVDAATFKASIEAVIGGKSDAVLLTTIHPYARKLQASKRGLSWLMLPHADGESWQRLRAVHPLALKNIAPAAVGLAKGKGHQGFAHPYPVLITTAAAAEDTVYQVLKAMMERHGDYARKAPGAGGWALKNQAARQPWPQHPGAIRYWREKGLWDTAAQAHQKKLLDRQSVLRAAWATFAKSGRNSKQDWARIRAAALAAAGHDVIFRNAGLR